MLTFFRVWKWCYTVILQLDPWLRTHPLMSHGLFSESGRGAVRTCVGSSTVRRPQPTDVTGYGSQRKVPGALLDVYRYICLFVSLSVRACVRASMRAVCLSVCLYACMCMQVCVENNIFTPANVVSEGYVFTGVCLSMGGGLGVLSQHALQVVSQHALQQVSGLWYPSMPCSFPRPTPKGEV